MGMINWNHAADDVRLEYILSENEEYNDAILGMLQNNTIPGVLPFTKLQMNNQRILQYSLPAGQSIQDINPGAVSRETLLSVLKELANIVYHLKEYMIEDSYVLWDADYIFLSNEKNVQVICIPVEQSDPDSFPIFCSSLFDMVSEDVFTDSEINMFKECLFQKKFDAREFYGLLDKADISFLAVNKRKMEKGQHVVLKKEPQNPSKKNQNAVVLDRRIHSETNKQKDRSPIILKRKSNHEESEKNGLEETVFITDENDETNLLSEAEDETVMICDEDSEETVMLTKPSVTGSLVRLKTGERYPVAEEENTIGRSKCGNTIIISGNLFIGRHHACIRRNKDHFVFIDMNSKNQSYLNGEKMEYGKEYCLEHGDEIRLADEQFQFCVDGSN